jgi:F-type H+-transporting ATPase subunit epsilon
MADTLKLNILSPERKLLDQTPVEVVTLPGSEGQIQILPGHAAMVGTLHTGTFRYRTAAGAEETGAISTGFFEVGPEFVNVLAETIELRSEIDVPRAQNAQSKAENALKDADMDEAKFRKYQLKLQRALVRQQAAARESH